jgi:hypothetical protein
MDDGSPAPVIGVVGGSGGVGSTTFAAVLAAVSATTGPAVLVDLDPLGGGIDVLLGAEHIPGPRWSGLRVAGGRLDPQLLADALPRWGPVSFLAADVVPDAVAVTQVVGVARQLGPVVLDLCRFPTPHRAAGIYCCDLVVLVCGANVLAVNAARSVTSGLVHRSIGAVVRTRRGGTSPERVAAFVGGALIGSAPAWSRPAEDKPLAAGALPRALRLLAGGVLDALTGPGAGRHNDD